MGATIGDDTFRGTMVSIDAIDVHNSHVFAVAVLRQGIDVDYLLSRSITTEIVSKPCLCFGNDSKFMATCCHEHSGIGRGCNCPDVLSRATCALLHSWQFRTYLSTSAVIHILIRRILIKYDISELKNMLNTYECAEFPTLRST